MQWGQIKTLLILSFLLLDVYLLFQFTEKQQQADLSVLEHNESTIEEQLTAENIQIPKLSEEEFKETFISVEPKLMLKKELNDLKELKNQENEVIQNKLIISELKKPVSIPKEPTAEKMLGLLEGLTLFSEEYSYWKWNEDANVLVYFQNKLDKPIFYNQNGLLLLYLNEKDEVTHYTQTVLGDYEENNDKRKLISPMRAIETLYEAEKFKNDDKIESVEIGFHTRVPLDNGVQVFAPTWNVKVNEGSHYFVNAIEEFIFSSEHQEFLKEALIGIEEKANLLKSKEIDKKEFLKELSKKIEFIERSDKDELTV